MRKNRNLSNLFVLITLSYVYNRIPSERCVPEESGTEENLMTFWLSLSFQSVKDNVAVQEEMNI